MFITSVIYTIYRHVTSNKHVMTCIIMIHHTIIHKHCYGFWVVSKSIVLGLIQACCAAVQHSQLKEQYVSLRVVVEETVNLNVQVDQLQDVKRTVRDLRRQYGHRLVDQKEFSQDPLNESMEELHRVSLLGACLHLTQFADDLLE